MQGARYAAMLKCTSLCHSQPCSRSALCVQTAPFAPHMSTQWRPLSLLLPRLHTSTRSPSSFVRRTPHWRSVRQIWTGVCKATLLDLAKLEISSSIARSQRVIDIIRELARLEMERDQLLEQRASEVDSELKQLYDDEISSYNSNIASSSWHLEEELLHAWSDDEVAKDETRPIIVEISPGVGGQEASLFAAELWAMYERFAEGRGWSFEEDQFVEGPAGGLQVASARLSGAVDHDGVGPYGWLQSESGVHRVQRVPVTDRKGRMQTSTAVIVVLPVASETDVTLPVSDVRIDVSKKSSGPGGQSVNAAHQAIRATHLPTGISVHCTSSPSQFENRTRALEMLRTKIFARQRSARVEFERDERKQQRGSGDRSEKIRTYNFQRDDVTDHRLGKDAGSHGAEDVVFGDGLEKILMAHRVHARSERVMTGFDNLRNTLVACDVPAKTSSRGIRAV